MEEFDITYRVVIDAKAKNKYDAELFGSSVNEIMLCLVSSIGDVWGESHQAKVHIYPPETHKK